MKAVRLLAAGTLLAAACDMTVACQAPQLAVGQPHTVILETDGDAAPTVQVAIPAAATGARSLVLQRDGQTVASVPNLAQATPSAWLAGGVDLWDLDAVFAPTLTYHVVASQGTAATSQDVTVQLSRSLTSYPQNITVDSSRSRTQPTIDWVAVDSPVARLASVYRINLAYTQSDTPEMSYFVGADQNKLDLSLPASWSTGQFREPVALSAGSRLEIQVVAIASTSTQTEEALSKAFYYTP